MSNNESFIDEVTEEVRKDRLFALYRRYGWIAALVVVAIVGGAAWTEFTKAQARAQAEALGDAVMAALEPEDPQTRISALQQIPAETAGARAVVAMLTAAEQANEVQAAAAAATLDGVARDTDVPEIYRQIASFKALTQDADAPLAARRVAFESLARPGNPLRLLAQEQLALIEIEAGDRTAAVAQVQAILEDAEVTAGLTRRANQLLIALGATPENG
ncbi:MAG: hypothetical protein ACPG7W_04600 [Paracoccaceae bacterium]